MPAPIDTLVTVFGGSGFLGRHVVRALAQRDYRLRVGVRRPELAGHLQPLGKVGQINPVQANVRYPASVEAAMRGAHVVVNLVGILSEGGAQRFNRVHARGAQVIAQAAARQGARVVHVSALGVGTESTSRYLASKTLGERAVLDASPDATIIRPSIVFGPEDHFANRFAALACLSPVLPLVGADTKLQPVFVGDVAAAIADAVDGKTQPGTAYEIGGPEVVTMRQAVETILRIAGRNPALIPLPFGLAKLNAAFLQFAPGDFKLTPDQVEMLKSDNVVSEAAKREGRTLEGLGIAPESMVAVLPSYLWRFRKAGQFARTLA